MYNVRVYNARAFSDWWSEQQFAVILPLYLRLYCIIVIIRLVDILYESKSC